MGTNESPEHAQTNKLDISEEEGKERGEDLREEDERVTDRRP